MRVSVTVSLDVDPAAWCLNYGTAPEEVREDVKTYVRSLVGEHLNDLGLLTDPAPSTLARELSR